MNADEKEKAISVLRSAFGGQAGIEISEDDRLASHLLKDVIYVKVALAGGGVEFTAFRPKTSSMASLRDCVSMISGSRDTLGQPLIWSSGLSEAKQDYLRGRQVPFLDDAGNAWLSIGSVYVDIRGRKARDKISASEKAANVFSDKATVVTRILLESGPLGVREISRIAAGKGFPLTPGYVSKVVSSLEMQNYAGKDKNGLVGLRRRPEMLKDWVHAYKRLSPSRLKRFYLAAPDPDELVEKVAAATADCAVLGELAAASLIDPFASFDSAYLLAKDFDAAEAALVSIGAREVDRGSNVELVVPRYKVSAFWGEQEVKGRRTASDLQVYLDLTRQPRRGLEAAEHLLERRLRAMLDEGDGDDRE